MSGARAYIYTARTSARTSVNLGKAWPTNTTGLSESGGQVKVEGKIPRDCWGWCKASGAAAAWGMTRSGWKLGGTRGEAAAELDMLAPLMRRSSAALCTDKIAHA